MSEKASVDPGKAIVDPGAAKARPRRILGLPTEVVGDTPADRDAWAEFLQAWTGCDLTWHMRQRTPGLSFAYACWLEGARRAKESQT